jgi:hypothetical protein
MGIERGTLASFSSTLMWYESGTSILTETVPFFFPNTPFLKVFSARMTLAEPNSEGAGDSTCSYVGLARAGSCIRRSCHQEYNGMIWTGSDASAASKVLPSTDVNILTCTWYSILALPISKDASWNTYRSSYHLLDPRCPSTEAGASVAGSDPDTCILLATAAAGQQT